MRILVVSDSHGNTNALMRAVSLTGPDMVLHMGDHDKDCKIIRDNMPQIPVRAVRGNCDPGSFELDNDEFLCEGKRIFMTHGHLYGVKYNLDRLLMTGLYKESDIILFGHTHNVYADEFEKMVVLNPGSIGLGQKTYAVLEIEHGVVKYEICYLDMWD